MDWRDLVPWLLFLHVLAAIVAIGPNFAYATIRGLGRQEPQHANFATRASHAISARLVYPIGLVIPATGIATAMPPAAGSSGPPPGLVPLATRAARGGNAMLILLVVVVALMVVKPQF